MSNDPVLIAYTARRGRNGRVHYERIGCAYPHNTGEGLTVVLHALPLKMDDPEGLRIVLLELDESDDRRLLAEAKRYERERKGRGSKPDRKKDGP